MIPYINVHNPFFAKFLYGIMKSLLLILTFVSCLQVSNGETVQLSRSKTISDFPYEELLATMQTEQLSIQHKFQSGASKVMETNSYNLVYYGPVKIGTPPQNFEVCLLVNWLVAAYAVLNTEI